MTSKDESELAGSTAAPQPLPVSQSNYGSVFASQLTHPGQRYSTPPSPRQSRASTIGAGAGAGIWTGPGTRQGSLRNSQSAQFQAHFQHDNMSVSSRSSYSTYSSSTSSLHNFDTEGAKHPSSPTDDQEMTSTQLFWTYVALAPILLSILVLFAGLLQLLPLSTTGVIVHWDLFGIGMLGWAVTFGVRTPIFAIVTRFVTTDPDLSEWYTLLPAALLEEFVRLGIIKSAGISVDFGAVYWLGLGWAGLETLYYIGQSLIYSRWGPTPKGYGPLDQEQGSGAAHISGSGNGEEDALLQHPQNGAGSTNVHGHHQIIKNVEDTPEVREVRHLLGIDRPWWSLMGRTSSMMVHIGLGCWLGHSGFRLLLPAAVVHGALYIVWGVFMPEHWSVPATSYGTLMAAMCVFLIGLALYGEIV
ncbi:MAG: hypothetical protein BYD32DRAFT_407095 [Podila humilis]|nr:MAG: hypothetical protein BYD32DRAFT_407095 [Podila humilis]